MSNDIDNFRDLIPNHTAPFLIVHIKKYTFRELLLNKSKQVSRVHIKHYWHFQGVTSKQYYALFQTTNNTNISSELLANNTLHFLRAYIKHNWHFQRVAGKHTFPELISDNTDIFRMLLANNTAHISRAPIKQYWHFQRVTLEFRIDGTRCLLIILFFATLSNLIQHSLFTNFGEFCQPPLLFQTHCLIIHMHS